MIKPLTSPVSMSTNLWISFTFGEVYPQVMYSGIKNPHNLLLRDAPDERDLSVMRPFLNNSNMHGLGVPVGEAPHA